MITIVGYIAIHYSSASTPVLGVEPETATLTGNVTVQANDSSASGNQAITFGNVYGPQPLSMPAGAISVDNAPYSAKGDGTTDDTAAVQAALNAAASSGTTGHPAVVWLTGGKTYLINGITSAGNSLKPDGLSVSSNTILEGGLSSTGKAAVLKFTWGNPNTNLNSPNLKQGPYLSNKHPSPTGAGQGSNGQYVYDSNIGFKNFVIEGANTDSTGAPGTGTPSGGPDTDPNRPPLVPSLRLGFIYGLTIDHIEIDDSPGLSMSYHSCHDATITNNYVHNSGRDGITGYWAAAYDANNNPISDASGNNTGVGYNTDTTIANNFVTKVGDDGIALNGLTPDTYNAIGLTSNVQITHNTILGWDHDPGDPEHILPTGKMLGRAIAIDGMKNVTVSNNSITNTSFISPGILISGCMPKFCPTYQGGPFNGMRSHDPSTGGDWKSDAIQLLNNTFYNVGTIPSIRPLDGDGSPNTTSLNESVFYIYNLTNSTIQGNRVVNPNVLYSFMKKPLGTDDGCTSGAANCSLQASSQN